MNYFNEDYLRAYLSEEEAEQKVQEYWDNLEKLLLKLKSAERIFAKLNFHDGKIIKFKSKTKKLSLTFLIGDLEQGYYKLKIKLKTKKQQKISRATILATEFSSVNNYLTFNFITTNFQEYQIKFLKVKTIKLSEISAKTYSNPN